MTFPTIVTITYLALTGGGTAAALTVLWARLLLPQIVKTALSIELVAAALLHGTVVPILLGVNPEPVLTTVIAAGLVVPLLLVNLLSGTATSTPPGFVGAVRLTLLHTLIPVPVCLILAVTGLTWLAWHGDATIGTDQTDSAIMVGIAAGAAYAMFSMLRPLARANTKRPAQPRTRATFVGEAIANGR